MARQMGQDQIVGRWSNSNAWIPATAVLLRGAQSSPAGSRGLVQRRDESTHDLGVDLRKLPATSSSGHRFLRTLLPR